MTSHPSRPRPSSGSSLLRSLALVLASVLFVDQPQAGAGAGAADAVVPSLEQVRGAGDQRIEIDWSEGTLTAVGGAAADLRMPSADQARPGAERRARSAAVAHLKAALAELPLGGSRALPPAFVERALGRARTVAVEYQSNGGAQVKLAIRFADWLPAPAPEGPALAVGAMRLQATPLVRAGKRDVVVGAARYRIGAPPAGAAAAAAKVDREGRLVLDGDRQLGDKFAGAAIVIYVQRVLK